MCFVYGHSAQCQCSNVIVVQLLASLSVMGTYSHRYFSNNGWDGSIFLRGSCPLLKYEKTTQNGTPKNKENFKSIDMAKQNVVIGVFRYAESKYGLYFVLALLLHRVLITFYPKHMMFLPVFCKTPIFWGKLGSQIFRNIRPWFS